jgi:hypothetical protein
MRGPPQSIQLKHNLLLQNSLLKRFNLFYRLLRLDHSQQTTDFPRNVGIPLQSSLFLRSCGQNRLIMTLKLMVDEI